MRKCALSCLTLIALSACNGDTAVEPLVSATSPTALISDAVHSAGNPDFFFLPPMVPDPSARSSWEAGAFNPNLAPTVEICATATAGGACSAAPDVYPATLRAADEHYAYNWKVPKSSTIYYRITVRTGTKTLGFADVETAANASQLKNVETQEYIPLVDGSTLPVKFRIERYALCEVPGTGPCTSASGDIFTAPLTVTSATEAMSTGITFPVQTGFTSSTPVTVTVSACDDLNPRVLDLPTFGDCVRVTTDRDLPRLSDAATVFICAVGVGTDLFAGLSEDQERRVTLHQYDADGPNQGLRALPHAPACSGSYPGSTASIQPSLRTMLASLARGHIGRAASQAIALLAPKPLYAAMFIDLGGGGYSEACCSDFQFALPAKMEVVDGTSDQNVLAGSSVSPTVRVTDLGGAPVAGAVVHFFSGDPATAGGTAVLTSATGEATTPWTVGPGPNTMPVSGRGLASPATNGPRDGFDPFQPVQSAFDGTAPPSGSVPVQTGSLTFSATGAASGFESGDLAWTSTGFWHSSSVTDISNARWNTLVVSATGDASRGALPGPFTGVRALWFGNDADGHYAGALASETQLGGTSTAPRAGMAVSPEFVVPNGFGSVQLTFRSWFEIESRNPSSFDMMRVTVRDVVSGASATLQLNPSADPDGAPQTPFTSGGFNLPPVWQSKIMDLSAFKGRRVTVTFSFDTRDSLYNAFRGWIVDDVALQSGPSSISTLIPLRPSFSTTATADAPTRVYQP